MKHTLKQITLISAILGFSSAAYADDLASDTRNFYVGIDGGYSIPLQNKLDKTIQGSKVSAKLENSTVYEARAGYVFYPNLAAEISYSYRPSYTLKTSANYTFVHPAAGAIKIPLHAQTKVKYESAILSLVYFAPTDTVVTPFFSVGAGVARITPNHAIVYANLPGLGITKAGTFTRHVSIVPAVRLGLGANFAVTDSLALSLAGKVEVAKEVRVPVYIFNPATRAVVIDKHLKTPFGTAEFTVGLRYSL